MCFAKNGELPSPTILAPVTVQDCENFQDMGITSHGDNWIAMSINSKVLTWFFINKIILFGNAR